MTAKDIDNIMASLDKARAQKKQIQLTKAQAEIDTISRCADAYFDGLYDMAREIKNLLPTEENNGEK